MDLRIASQSDLEARHQLAVAAARALIDAGFPTHLEDGSERPRPGAAIEIDKFVEEDGGGVFVQWHVADDVVEEFAEPLLAGDFDHPSIRHHGAVVEARVNALLAALRESGFTAELSDDEYRPYTVKVIARTE